MQSKIMFSVGKAVVTLAAQACNLDQQALRTDEKMPLLAFDLLTAVKAGPINRPPFWRFSGFDCR